MVSLTVGLTHSLHTPPHWYIRTSYSAAAAVSAVTAPGRSTCSSACSTASVILHAFWLNLSPFDSIWWSEWFCYSTRANLALCRSVTLAMSVLITSQPLLHIVHSHNFNHKSINIKELNTISLKNGYKTTDCTACYLHLLSWHRTLINVSTIDKSSMSLYIISYSFTHNIIIYHIQKKYIHINLVFN